MPEFHYSPSIEEAIKQFPVLKSTVNKAVKQGIQIIRHAVTYTKRGAVYQHWFWYLDKNEDNKIHSITRQSLHSQLTITERIQRELETQRKDFTPKKWVVVYLNQDFEEKDHDILEEEMPFVEAEKKAEELKKEKKFNYCYVFESDKYNFRKR